MKRSHEPEFLQPSPEEQLSAKQQTKQEAEKRRQELLSGLPYLLRAVESPVAQKIIKVAPQLPTLALEVFVRRMAKQPLTYAEIAWVFQERYENLKITEVVVQAMAEEARKAFLELLSSDEERQLKEGKLKAPRLFQNFLLGK